MPFPNTSGGGRRDPSDSFEDLALTRYFCCRPRRWVVHVTRVTSSKVVVAVDVGKTCVALSVTDSARDRLLGPVEFAMTTRR